MSKCLHDWRLAEQVAVRVDETHSGPLAVWYCTRCRLVEEVVSQNGRIVQVRPEADMKA